MGSIVFPNLIWQAQAGRTSLLVYTLQTGERSHRDAWVYHPLGRVRRRSSSFRYLSGIHSTDYLFPNCGSSSVIPLSIFLYVNGLC